MKFTKMHGAGNSFVVIENLNGAIAPENYSALARKLCDVNCGIGADGMMIIVPAEMGGDFAMRFYNSDGSMGEMCGNGARCICRYAYETGLSSHEARVETTAGLVTGQRLDSSNYRIRLNDASTVLPHCSVSIKAQSYDCAYVELGCPGLPHAIVELPGWKSMDRDELRELGRALRFAEEFPRGANVSFVDVTSGSEVDIITFERGVEDFTLACGTGCGSAATALRERGRSGDELLLHAPGGDLRVELKNDGAIFLSGPTCIVCRGETEEV